MQLWIAGNTVPDARANGMLCVPPQGGWPAAGSLSPDEAKDYVYKFLTGYSGTYADLIPDSEKDRAALIYGWDNWNDAHTRYPNAGAVLAAVYLNVCLVGKPLPEDFDGDVGSIAHDWPDQGDNEGRLIYAWDFHIDEWGGPGNAVPKLRARQALQVQKWSDKDQIWKIYNQWGEDLVFYFDPKANTWSANFDIGEWLNEHGNVIFTVSQAIFSAIASFFGVGAVIAATENAFRALAIACATGDPDKIASALLQALAAVEGLPGGADAVNQLAQAGQGITQDMMKSIVSTPLVAHGIAIVSTAMGDVNQIVAQADALRKMLNISDAQVAKASATAVANIRQQLIPPYLQPWFDRSFKLGGAAASIAVPFYAQGIWSLGTAYGVLLGQGSQHAARGINIGDTVLSAPGSSEATGGITATRSLLSAIGTSEATGGITALPPGASVLTPPSTGILGSTPSKPILVAVAGAVLGALAYYVPKSPVAKDKRVFGGFIAAGIVGALFVRNPSPPLPKLSTTPPPPDRAQNLLQPDVYATTQRY